MAGDHSCGQQTGAAHLRRLFVVSVAEWKRVRKTTQPAADSHHKTKKKKWSAWRAIKVIDKHRSCVK
jgi:hypothetical protein